MPSLKRKPELFETLKREIVARKDYLHGEPVETVYFGGGTPSLLMVDEIGELLNLIKAHYELTAEPERSPVPRGCAVVLFRLRGAAPLSSRRLPAEL